jgi:hypothetical protein
MKKYFFISILLIIRVYQSSAQKTKDVLYLKNGSVINGTLIEITDNQYKIQTSDGSLFIFSAPEVDKFVKETPAFEGRKKDGFSFGLEAGFLVGSQSSRYVLPFSFNCIAGYTIDTKNIFGLGSGVEYLGQTFTPLYFEYKYLFYDKKITPFVFFRTGVLLHLGSDMETTDSYNYPQYNVPKDYSGGASLAIGTGISWAKEDIETYLSFAYRYAQTSYKESNYMQQDATFKTNFNRLELKFGFKF